MNSNNKVHTFGDNNIILTDITARDINIITGYEDSSEIRSEKKIIAEHLAHALNQLGKLQGIELNSCEEESDDSIDDSDFPGINWKDLIEAIEMGNCVLFIGQDISVDEKNKSLHENFFTEITGRRIEYDIEDGFFMPGADRQIETKALKFYKNDFNTQNIRANKILDKLAEIPFSLIVPVCPDDSFHRIYDSFNKNHCFHYYKPKEKQKTQAPSKANPIIYNLLGNAAADGKYIYTHEQFYKYINEDQEIKLPMEIESKIKSVPLYLFIGIDFNRWYNRLLLFTLSLYQNSEAYTLNSHKINNYTQVFIDKQFNILDIESNYDNFSEIFYRKCRKAGISFSLYETFIENTKLKLLEIKELALKSKSSIELTNITIQIESINDKIQNLLNQSIKRNQNATT